MDISDKPSFAFLFDVRVASCKSCCNSFGASGNGRDQERRQDRRLIFTFQTSSFVLDVLANLFCDGWIQPLLLGHLLLNLCPG